MTQSELEMLLALPGWCGERKMQDIYSVVYDLHGPVVGIEIGTLAGRSLFPAALALRDRELSTGERGHVVGIDPYGDEHFLEGSGVRPPASPPHPGVAGLDECRAIAIATAKRIGLDWCSILVAPSGRVGSHFGSIDYLHIDGNHTSDVALRDAQSFVSKLRSGGIVILDDCDFPSLGPAREFVAAVCSRLITKVRREDDVGSTVANDYEIWEK